MMLTSAYVSNLLGARNTASGWTAERPCVTGSDSLLRNGAEGTTGGLQSCGAWTGRSESSGNTYVTHLSAEEFLGDGHGSAHGFVGVCRSGLHSCWQRACEHLRVPERWWLRGLQTQLCSACYQRWDQRAAGNGSYFSIGEQSTSSWVYLD